MTVAGSLARFGLAVGHATDAAGATGCTVVRGIERPHRCQTWDFSEGVIYEPAVFFVGNSHVTPYQGSCGQKSHPHGACK